MDSEPNSPEKWDHIFSENARDKREFIERMERVSASRNAARESAAMAQLTHEIGAQSPMREHRKGGGEKGGQS